MDSRIETYKHIQEVQRLLNRVVVDFLERSEEQGSAQPDEHDFSLLTLMDLIEILCNWFTADADIYELIENNQAKLGYSDKLKRILNNTAYYLEKRL